MNDPGPTVDEIRAHIADGWSLARIARHHGVADSTIGRRARNAGIKAPGKVHYPDLPDAAALTRAMATETVAQLATRYGVREETIRNRLKAARRRNAIATVQGKERPNQAMTADARPACNGMDLHRFFPEQGRGQGQWIKARAAAEAARDVCRACPIRIDCLRGALERREPHGVWGGELFSAGKPISPNNLFNPSRRLYAGMDGGDTAAGEIDTA